MKAKWIVMWLGGAVLCGARVLGQVPEVTADNGTRSSTGPAALAHFRLWAENYAQTPKGDAAKVARGVVLAKARRLELKQMIRRDPKEAIRSAIPWALRKSLPPEIAGLLEERVSARADLNVIFARPPAGQESKVSEPVIRTVEIDGRFYYVHTYGKRLRQFSTSNTAIIGIAVDDQLALLDQPYRVMETGEATAPEYATHGAAEAICPACHRPVEVSAGVLVDAGGQLMAFHSAEEVPAVFTTPEGEIIWAAGGSGGSTTNSPIRPPTNSQGDKYFLFMRVRFADDSPTYEPETDSQVRGDLDTVVRRFAELSYGTLQGRYGFTPTMTLPKPRSGYMNGWSSTDGMYALLADAKTAASAIASDPAFPGVPYPYHTTNYQLFAVRWNGEPGGCCSYGGGGNAWIRWDGASVLIHEWGHAVGQPHANWWNPTTDDPIGPGTHEEYGNKFDNMGSGGIEEDFSAKHKALVNWLPPANYWVPANNGVYRVYAHDQPTLITTNRYGIRVFRPTRNEHQVWVEHRAYTVSGANAVYWTNGVALGRELDWELLDMTPGSSKGKDDCTLTIGRTWSDHAAGVHYTPVQRGNTPQPWVDVAVYFDNGSNYPPVAVVRASSYEPGPGAAITLSASAVDPDGDTLAYAWDFGDATQSYNNLPIQTKSWSVAGQYVVRCVVSDRRGGSYSKSLLIRVGTPATYQISGRILDSEGNPMPDVVVRDGSGRSAFTDTDGSYIMANLASGAYSLRPLRNGHTFSPSARALAVGPSATGADFSSTSLVGPGHGAWEEYWLNIGGGNVTDLTGNVRFPNSPDGRFQVADAFEIPEDWRDSYGSRLRGYFVPPLSGAYRFFVASDDGSELYLSPGVNPAQKTRIAYVSGWVNPRAWTAQANQRSGLLQLAAGQRYYIEALQKEGAGGDHLSVGIDLPDGSQEAPVAWHRIVPFNSTQAPSILVSIAATDDLCTEGADGATFTLTRTGSTTASLDVYLHFSGTALYGTDYNALPLVQTIPAGSSSLQIALVPINDALAETGESVVASLVAGPNYSVAQSTASALIHDNDGTPVITVVASAPNASKIGPIPGRFTVSRTGSPAAALAINLNMLGTAINGVDYAPVTNVIIFSARQAAVEVEIEPLPGSAMEPPKTAILSLLSGNGYMLGAPATATVTISQPGPGFGITREWFNDIGSAGTVAGLTNNANFPATPSGSEYRSDFFEGPVDSADNYGSRYRGWFIPPMTGSYTFFIASDDSSELWLGTSAAPETKRRIAYLNGWTSYRNWTAQASQRSAAVTLSAGQRYYIEALHAEGGGGDHCSVGVQFPNGQLDRPISAQWLEPWSAKGVMLAVFASDPQASESGDAGEFVIRRTGSTASSLAFTLSIGGTALNGSDYVAITATHTFAAGVSELRIPVQARADALLEGPETITLTLSTSAVYDLGFANSATVTIIGEPPAAALAALDAVASEGPTNTALFRVQIAAPVFGPVTFNYKVGGTASNGIDIVALPGQVTLLQGQSVTNITVTALADSEYETTETLHVTLSPGAGYVVGAASNITLNIENTTSGNAPPVLSPIADQTIIAGQRLTITNTATDPDLPPQTLTYSLLSAPEGAAIDAVSGLFTWRPTLAQSPLIAPITVRLQDDGTPSMSATQSFVVFVTRPATPSLGQPELGAAGFVLTLNGDPGPDYHIQSSTNLVEWSTVTVLTPLSLPVNWTDSTTSNAPTRFYRVLLGP